MTLQNEQRTVKLNKDMKRGFTLIEIMSVTLILAILAGFLYIQGVNYINAGKDAKRKADIELIKNALIQYRSENYSKGSVQPATCEIGGGCSELDSDIQPLLENLPKDPDGASYTYRSDDGTDCTISAILSNGSSYTYDCDAKTSTTGTAVNGVCGSITSATTLTSDASGLCSQGVPVLFSGTGPWTWTCSGTDGGDNDTCLAFVQMTCFISSSDCSSGAVEIFRMYSVDGGHAELSGQGNYSQRVCCAGPEISDNCSATKNAVALKLYSATNAHVEQNTLTNYTNSVCLSTSNDYDVTCGYASSCSLIGPQYQCLASMSDATNAHVGGCSDTFATKVCCNIY